MRSYSHQDRDDDIPGDAFDDDPDELNDSSADLNFRRSKVNSSNHQVIHRALSTVSANQTLVHNQRNLLAKNFRRISVNDDIVTIDHNDADASFLLPNLHDLPDEIRARVIDSLVDTPTMTTLEETKRLNWWVNKKLPCPKLYPLLTNGDGNCLLHATSLAMWGFHDHSLSMRKALNETMITSKPNNSLYRRWRWAQSVQNKKYGLVFSEQEWNEEWKSLLRLSSAEPRISQTNTTPNSSDVTQRTSESNRGKSSQTMTSVNTGGSTKSSSQTTRQYYESLEEFHVYVLANNIRRPIIVYSDTVLRTNDGEAISPIEFGGIYLPLEIPPEKCHKQPVFLAFDAAHFSALVPMEPNSKLSTKATYRIPLIDMDTSDLSPIHFFVDPGPSFSWPIDEELSDEIIHLYTRFGGSRMEILEAYLNLSKEMCPLDLLHSTGTSSVPPTDDESTSNVDRSRTPSTQIDSTSSIQESTSASTPVMEKKSSRTSSNFISRMIRRKFIEPFSLSKRASLKQRQQTNPDASESSMTNESESKRRLSSPLLNTRTNILTIIVTNFQPKRPKSSDNMIKNYIDKCMNEYRLEQSQQKALETSVDENDYRQGSNSSPDYHGSRWKHEPSVYQTSMASHRSYSSTTANRPQHETDLATKIIEQRRIVQLPNSPPNVVKPSGRHVQKNYDMDDNDDSLAMDNGQLSSDVNYLQKKSSQIAQSNSLQLNQSRHHYAESYINGLPPSRTKTNQITEPPIYRSNTKGLLSTFQPALLKRQQSLGYDRYGNTSRLTDPPISQNRSSVRTKISLTQPKRSSNEGSSRLGNVEQARRS